MAATVPALTAVALSLPGPAGAGYSDPNPGPNPCQGPQAEGLLCPDLRAAPPYDMYVDRSQRPGRVLLRARNNIQSRGLGPLEIRGRRIGKRTMRITQHIRRRGGGRLRIATNGLLYFYDVPLLGPFWKFKHALRFELWSLDADGDLGRRVRTGPKIYYCFRDLKRTAPSGRSPGHRVYPACSQDRRKRKRTLGISVGWSDTYGPGYDRQWINVKGLRGCFAFIHRVDPLDHLYELDEENNVGQRLIRLPARGKRLRSCASQ